MNTSRWPSRSGPALPLVTAEHLAAIRLARLPGVGPRRLRALLDHRAPIDAVSLILDGSPGSEPWSEWAPHLRADLAKHSDDALREQLGESGVILRGEPTYPAALAADHEAPAVLFYRGDLDALRTRRVAVIGTRHCTERGRAIAVDVGRTLAGGGVSVVSGLALGIDAAAHRGVMAAREEGASGRPVAIVASGLDVVYPRANGGLWKVVAESGLIITESPPGTAPDRFRFPLRNRLIAALGELVLVVESRIQGGSMITVDEALKRDVPVMAVPGPVDLPVSAGTNQLLRDGAHVMAEVGDVLVALGLHAAVPTIRDRRPAPDDRDRDVLAVFRDVGPLTFDMVVDRMRARSTNLVGATMTDCALSLGRLEAQGWIITEGGWFELLPSPSD